MDDTTREQFNIFLSHINKGVLMETNEKTTIKVDEPTTGEKSCAWLKAARVALHARMVSLDGYKENNAASKRYISLASTSFERSRMFMGKLMGAYGTPNPYKDGYKPQNNIVDKIVDTYDGAVPSIIAGKEIAYTKQLRVDASEMIKGLETFFGHFPFNTNGNLFLMQATISLHDATNWLGMELWSLDQKTPDPAVDIKEKEVVLNEDVKAANEIDLNNL